MYIAWHKISTKYKIGTRSWEKDDSTVVRCLTFDNVKMGNHILEIEIYDTSMWCVCAVFVKKGTMCWHT